MPCVSNALDKSYLEDFKRIEDYLEEVTQDNTYNKIHFYNGNSDHATIDSPQELCEAADVIAEVAESYNMSLSESVSNLSNEEVNTQREEICVTVQFDSNYFQTDEFIEFSKERYTLKNREEVREFRQRLNAFSKSYHDNLVAQNMHIVSDLNYIEADVVGYAPFVILNVLPEDLSTEALLDMAKEDTVLNISLNCESDMIMEIDDTAANNARANVTPTDISSLSQVMADGIYTGDGVRIGVYEAFSATTGSLSHVNLVDKDITLKDANDPITSHLVNVASVIATIAPDAEFYFDVIGEAITLDWFIDEGCDIVNCSFGAARGQYDYGRDGLFDYQILAHYITVVVAAGNEGSNLSSPGYAYNVITVGGVDKTYTNSAYRWIYAPEANYIAPNQQVKPNISAAYTVNIPNVSGTKRGTSYATPQVTGAIALLQSWGYIYSLSPELALSVVTSSAQKTYDYSATTGGFDARVGAGVLDIDRMFEAALNYIDGANDNDYEGDIITKKIYVTAGEELQVGFAWLITAEEVRNSHADLHITDYDVKIYDYLYADQPIASSTSTNSNVEVVRYTPQYDGQVWVVVTQNDPIDWSYIEYDYYALTYAGGMETPYG